MTRKLENGAAEVTLIIRLQARRRELATKHRGKEGAAHSDASSTIWRAAA